MNLLYLSAPGGGLETNVRVLAPALRKAGHQVSILYLSAPQNGHPLPSDELPTYYAPIGNWHYYLHRATLGWTSLPLVARSFEAAHAFTQAVHSIHRRHPIDLVEVPEIAFRAHRLPVPYVVRLHSPAWLWRRMCNESIHRADRSETKREAKTLRGAAAVSAPSREVADYILSTCDASTVPLTIIPLPVDTTQFAPGQKSPTPLVLFVGRIERRKGADTFLGALPRVLAWNPDCEFVFAGRVCEELSELVTGAPPQARLLGSLPREELVQWYQRAWVFVAPSLWDNSPYTIYEAMSCGTPVVATRVGGIPELVDDGETGVLVPPRDEYALAKAIVALLDNLNTRECMGRNAREKAIACYATASIAQQTLALYNRVLSRRGA